MSYSNHARAASAYKEREVLTASPARLVVIVYDHVLANLQRARVARDAKRPDVQVEAIGRARDGIMELLVTLDAERGGQIATNLQALYSFMLQQLVDGLRIDAHTLQRMITMTTELRESFAVVAAGPQPVKDSAA
jgi:flagellar secretion chaperone FliS